MRMINKILLSLIAVLCLDATVTAQNKQVSGTVTDPAGAPVVGATVLVEGTTIGSTTDASGHFSLNAPEDAKLNISFIGYESQQVDVAGRTHIPVSLKEDSHTIDDVVVTAMGITRSEKTLGYSVSTVKSDELTKARDGNILNALSGKVAGVNISSSSGTAGGSSRIIIRGQSSLGSSGQPLFVIDGMPVSNQSYDPENKYSVPYTWGTVGLIYNTKYISEEDAQSWSCLWNSKYAGKLLMFDNPRDAFAIVESMLGYSYNTEDAQELKNAADLLATQKPVLQAYVMDQIFDKLERGEAWAAPYYAGDYLTMVEENPDLAFSFPEEGFNFFSDAMCIPKGCQNKEGAEAFINFLCRPDIAVKNFEYITYSTPNKGAFDLLDADLQNNKALFPDIDDLKNAEVLQYLGDEVDDLYNEAWKEVKAE